MDKHKLCPDENSRCQHGDDLNCPALAPVVDGKRLVIWCHDGQRCGQNTTGCWGECMRESFAKRDSKAAA